MVHITAAQPWATRPLRALQRPGCRLPYSAVVRTDHHEVSAVGWCQMGSQPSRNMVAVAPHAARAATKAEEGCNSPAGVGSSAGGEA